MLLSSNSGEIPNRREGGGEKKKKLFFLNSSLLQQTSPALYFLIPPIPPPKLVFPRHSSHCFLCWPEAVLSNKHGVGGLWYARKVEKRKFGKLSKFALYQWKLFIHS